MLFAWFAVLAAVGGEPARISGQPSAPQEAHENWAWNCEAVADPELKLGEIKATVTINANGKPIGQDVTWKAIIGGSGGPSVDATWSFYLERPTDLHGSLIFLRPGLKSKLDHDALWKREFRLRVSLEADPHPDWLWGYFDFVRPKQKWSEQYATPSFDADASLLLATARGSDGLYLVAQDKHGKTILSQDLRPKQWTAMYDQAQKLAKIAADKASRYESECTGFDNTPIIVVMNAPPKTTQNVIAASRQLPVGDATIALASDKSKHLAQVTANR